MAAEAPETIASARGIELGTRPTEVALAPDPGERPLAARLATLSPGRRLYLVLKNARAGVPPSALYRVYLGPRSAASPAGGAEPVGSVNFFNAETGRPRDYSFDVTDRLKALRATGTLGPLTATIAPTARPDAAAKPTIDEILLVAQ